MHEARAREKHTRLDPALNRGATVRPARDGTRLHWASAQDQLIRTRGRAWEKPNDGIPDLDAHQREGDEGQRDAPKKRRSDRHGGFEKADCSTREAGRLTGERSFREGSYHGDPSVLVRSEYLHRHISMHHAAGSCP